MGRIYAPQTNYEKRMKDKGFIRPRVYVPPDRKDELLNIADMYRAAYLDYTLGADAVEVTIEVSLDRLEEFYEYVDDFRHL